MDDQLIEMLISSDELIVKTIEENLQSENFNSLIDQFSSIMSMTTVEGEKLEKQMEEQGEKEAEIIKGILTPNINQTSNISLEKVAESQFSLTEGSILSDETVNDLINVISNIQGILENIKSEEITNVVASEPTSFTAGISELSIGNLGQVIDDFKTLSNLNWCADWLQCLEKIVEQADVVKDALNSIPVDKKISLGINEEELEKVDQSIQKVKESISSDINLSIAKKEMIEIAAESKTGPQELSTSFLNNFSELTEKLNSFTEKVENNSISQNSFINKVSEFSETTSKTIENTFTTFNDTTKSLLEKPSTLETTLQSIENVVKSEVKAEAPNEFKLEELLFPTQLPAFGQSLVIPEGINFEGLLSASLIQTPLEQQTVSPTPLVPSVLSEALSSPIGSEISTGLQTVSPTPLAPVSPIGSEISTGLQTVSPTPLAPITSVQNLSAPIGLEIPTGLQTASPTPLAPVSVQNLSAPIGLEIPTGLQSVNPTPLAPVSPIGLETLFGPQSVSPIPMTPGILGQGLLSPSEINVPTSQVSVNKTGLPPTLSPLSETLSKIVSFTPEISESVSRVTSNVPAPIISPEINLSSIIGGEGIIQSPLSLPTENFGLGSATASVIPNVVSPAALNFEELLSPNSLITESTITTEVNKENINPLNLENLINFGTNLSNAPTIESATSTLGEMQLPFGFGQLETSASVNLPKGSENTGVQVSANPLPFGMDLSPLGSIMGTEGEINKTVVESIQNFAMPNLNTFESLFQTMSNEPVLSNIGIENAIASAPKVSNNIEDILIRNQEEPQINLSSAFSKIQTEASQLTPEKAAVSEVLKNEVNLEPLGEKLTSSISTLGENLRTQPQQIQATETATPDSNMAVMNQILNMLTKLDSTLNTMSTSTSGTTFLPQTGGGLNDAQARTIGRQIANELKDSFSRLYN